MIAVGAAPLAVLKAADHLEKQTDGTVTVVLTTGEVLSVQPDGSQETRPAGTNGGYERARVCGNVLVFQPKPGIVHAFAYMPELPN